MKLTYMPAQEDDIEPLFQLNKELIDRYENIHQIDYTKVMSWVHSKLENHISEYTCIFQNNHKSGYYHFYSVDGMMELDDLYVFPLYQGQGIGSEIIRKCISETNLPIFLYVFIQNLRAVSLYKKFGFKITKTIGSSRYIMQRHSG